MRISTKVFILAGFAVALVLAFLVSPYASAEPDGLERVASDTGIDVGVDEHALADGPLADYAVGGVDSDSLATGLAGVIGVTVTFAVAAGVLMLARAARPRTGPRQPEPV